jgi:hypothetical protein
MIRYLTLALVLLAATPLSAACIHSAAYCACIQPQAQTLSRLYRVPVGGDADIDIATGGTIRIKCSDKFNSLVCPGRSDTSELIFLHTFGAEN